jgi:hypothetical protein
VDSPIDLVVRPTSISNIRQKYDDRASVKGRNCLDLCPHPAYCLLVTLKLHGLQPKGATPLSFSALTQESADLKTTGKVALRDHSNHNGTSANMSTALLLGKPLTSVSIVLPVINETFSLSQTIDILETENGDVIKEYIIVVSPRKTIPASIEVCNELRERLPTKVIVLPQQRPFLGGLYGCFRRGYR